MDEAAILDKIKDVVADKLDADPADVVDTASFMDDLGADSLRYLPVESIARAIALPAEKLCQACVTGEYPTRWCASFHRQYLISTRA